MNADVEPRRTKRGFFLLPIGLGILLAGGALISSGCHRSPDEKGDDDAFLRTKPTETKALDYDTASSLFPLKPGDWWEYQVQKTTAQAGEKPVAAAPYRERAVVTGPVKVGNNSGSGILFTGSPRGSRTEINASTAEGVFIMGVVQAKGAMKSLTMSSPLPLLRFPAKEGDYTNWDGRLEYAQNTSPASACSRVTAWEPVKTPAGTFDAWRVDTVFVANINGQMVRELNTRWFAPGYGLVRQELRSNNEQIISVLTSDFRGSKR